VDLWTRTSLRLWTWPLAALLLACASEPSTPTASACVQSRQQPRHFDLAARCALEEAGLRPNTPEAERRVRDVVQRFVAAGITPEDVAPERWKALTRRLRKPAQRPTPARKNSPTSIAGSPATVVPESPGLAARTDKIIQNRLATAPEAELFLAIAYGQIPHERAREPLIERGLVREKHREDVRSGSVAVGMSDLEVVLSQGRVAEIDTVKDPSGVRRHLIYPEALVITLDGFVTSWEDAAP
jgi:hypothetical protein